MSVLKSRRSESVVQFITTANEICDDVIAFISRLSARYDRYLGVHIVELANQVADHAEMANSIYPSDDTRKTLREQHILEARASLSALDVQMGRLYRVLMQNPQGCYNTAKGKPVSPKTAMERLDKMSQSLGEKIDYEDRLLTALLKSDKKR